MNTPQETASVVLQDLYLEHLLSVRACLYEAMAENREETNYENVTVREEIQANIKRIGVAIEAHRALPIIDVRVEDVLIEQVRHFNHMRYDNRERVKELAFNQSVHKSMLAEVQREISRIESEIESDYLDPMIDFYAEY